MAPVVPDTRWTSQAAEALNVADNLQQNGDWEQAIVHYRRALALSPTPPAFQRYVIYNNLGWSMYHLGEWTSAEEHYRHALRSSPAAPPTDHAYINLATLHKAERRVKPTIKAYRAAVSLTHQSPTWAQLGWALMLDFKVEEAVHTLEDALSYRGESAPAAQETHNYLGFLYSFRRDWASASTHFVKAVDLGLPSNATGCRAGRWAVSEGWSSGGGVTVHPIAWTQVRRAVTFSDELQQQRAVAAGRAARPLYYPNASEFVDEHTGATHADAAAGARARRQFSRRNAPRRLTTPSRHHLPPHRRVQARRAQGRLARGEAPVVAVARRARLRLLHWRAHGERLPTVGLWRARPRAERLVQPAGAVRGAHALDHGADVWRA